jgi:hypothetical protein
VGAVGGIPLNIVSAGAITGGLALAGAGAAGLITEAAGASETELLYRESSGIDRGDRRDETGQFTTKNGGARGDAYVKEQEGLDEMATEFNSEVIRTQVRAEVEGAKSHRYFDGLMEKADGSFMGIEVKSGSGVPSPNQKNFDPLVSETNPATAKLNGKIIQITETYLKEVP